MATSPEPVTRAERHRRPFLPAHCTVVMAVVLQEGEMKTLKTLNTYLIPLLCPLKLLTEEMFHFHSICLHFVL